MRSDVDADGRHAEHGTVGHHRTKRLLSGMHLDGKSDEIAHPDPDFVFEGVDGGGSRNASIGLDLRGISGCRADPHSIGRERERGSRLEVDPPQPIMSTCRSVKIISELVPLSRRSERGSEPANQSGSTFPNVGQPMRKQWHGDVPYPVTKIREHWTPGLHPVSATALDGRERSRTRYASRLLMIALSPIALVGASVPEHGAAGPLIGAPPATLRLDPFYKRHVDAGGLPIVSSAAVPDAALLAARDIVSAMLIKRPDLRRAMIARGFRVAIMAEKEGTVDLPEQRDWRKPTRDDPRLTVCERKLYDERIGRLSDGQYWNERARGMGGDLTSAATENLLGVPGTRYFGENIFVHEFSHGILEAVRTADTKLYARIERAYAAAMARGMWRGEYAATTVDEYWAEGTQTWFNSNRLAVVDGRRILNDADLASYDPALSAALSEVYGNRHRLPGDVFHMHPARVPPGPPPVSTAEVC